MELIDSTDIRLLTNTEVLQLIKDKLDNKKKIRSQQTLLYTGAKYLNSKTPASKQTEDSVVAFAAAVKRFGLTKPEVLMLINHCPTSQVELSVMITDLDVRISPEETDQLLNLIKEHFGEAVIASHTINSTGSLQESEDNQ